MEWFNYHKTAGKVCIGRAGKVLGASIQEPGVRSQEKVKSCLTAENAEDAEKGHARKNAIREPLFNTTTITVTTKTSTQTIHMVLSNLWTSKI